MNNIEIYNYWLESSNSDYETMYVLYEAQKYTWCLFFGHLVIEKLLKGIYAKKNAQNPFAPKTHNLILIASKGRIKIDNYIEENLKIINTFNISARYDSYKKEFYEKCTKKYTMEQLKNIEEIREWLKKQ